MTHDELLAKVTAENEGTRTRPVLALNALRAVVELHKSNQVDNAIWCSECSKRFENSGYYENYPCSTIQVIEKELE